MYASIVVIERNASIFTGVDGVADLCLRAVGLVRKPGGLICTEAQNDRSAPHVLLGVLTQVLVVLESSLAWRASLESSGLSRRSLGEKCQVLWPNIGGGLTDRVITGEEHTCRHIPIIA